MAELRSAGIARKALLARKKKIARLAAGLRRGEDDLQSDRWPDNLDRAADLEPHDVLEELQAAEARELAEIDGALQRIESGTYGQCERCGGSIGALRLRAVPEARFCMACSAGR
jgi:DnaK suppressor protein